MSGFDPRAYEDQVLKPLRKRLPRLSDDLLTRYAVDLTMDSAALRGRIERVVRVWNKAALKAGPTGLVCQQLLREHAELQRGGSANLTSPQWWQAREARRHQQLGSDIEDLAAVLESSHGPVGVITRGQLWAAAAAHPTLGDAEIRQACTIVGLEIVEPVALPAAAGMRGSFERLNTTLLAAGVDSIPRLLFPQLSTFGLLSGFTVSPLPTDRDAALSKKVADKRGADLDKAPDSPATRASREAVGMLVSEASGGTDLAALTLFHLLQEVRGKHAEGAQPRTLFILLTRRGLQDADAGRIVISVLGESGVRRDSLATVPAAAVAAVTADAEGCGVRIAWCPALDHREGTAFRVIRRTGREPARPDDGREIPIQSGHCANDDAPPVGQRVHYAVFARTVSLNTVSSNTVSLPAGQWSRPTCAMAQVVPPVTDVMVEGDSNAVTARWRAHPDVAAIEVHRTIGIPEGRGVPVAVDRHRAFRDETAVDGVQYFYTLIACYLHPGGGTALRSAPVVVRGATRPEAQPVTTLRVTPVAGPGLMVRLSWSPRPGSEIVIRVSPQPCPWEYGQLVTLAELAGYGAELEGTRTARGESMTLVAPVPPGRSYCVPFTLGAGGAVRGQDAVVALTAAVQRLRVQRFGDDVLLTWLWPDRVSAADVQWAGGSRRITAQQYRDEGGCHLRGLPGVSRVGVGAVMLGEGEEYRSSMTSVVVEKRPPELTYQLRRRGYPLLDGVRCVVTLSGAEPVSDVTVIIVAAAGHAMPLTPEAGVELLRQPVMIDPAVPLVLEAPIPPLRKPYWLRCFLAEPAPALLVDPPVAQLKVC